MSGHSKWHNIQAKKGKADAALAAGVFHYGRLTVGQVKAYLRQNGITVRG